MPTSLIVANVVAYVIVFGATFFGLATMLSGLIAMPFAFIQGKIAPGTSTGSGLLSANVILWLGVGALWGALLGGPMPLLLFLGVFLVYGVSAKEPDLTDHGFMVAGAEQWGVAIAAVAHAVLVGVRWF